MSRGKIRFAALISAIFVLFINICAFAKVDIPNHTDRFFINDYANVIDSETEDYIFEKGKAYNANGGPQVVVLTMESIDGNDLEDFSIETARKWGIGDKTRITEFLFSLLWIAVIFVSKSATDLRVF